MVEMLLSDTCKIKNNTAQQYIKAKALAIDKELKHVIERKSLNTKLSNVTMHMY